MQIFPSYLKKLAYLPWRVWKCILFALLGLCGILLYFLFRPQPIMPVVLLVKHYPILEVEKDFYRRVNPYGFLLGIPETAVYDPRDLRADLNQILKRDDIVFFIDQEGGRINRLGQFVPGFSAPAPQTLGDLATKDLTAAINQAREWGKITGEEMRKLTIDVAFAPNADLAPADDYESRDRYYSHDPKIAKVLADAYAEGLSVAGIFPCYKHAPGGAVVDKDPHLFTQKSQLSEQELRTRFLTPFSSANKYPFLMTGHAVYDHIDPANISTYSAKFYQFIRKELGYEGLIVTDALNMVSARGDDPDSLAARMTLALEAGADLLLPFFPYSAGIDWKEKRINKIPRKYVRRFNKKLKQFKASGKLPRN